MRTGKRKKKGELHELPYQEIVNFLTIDSPLVYLSGICNSCHSAVLPSVFQFHPQIHALLFSRYIYILYILLYTDSTESTDMYRHVPDGIPNGSELMPVFTIQCGISHVSNRVV